MTPVDKALVIILDDIASRRENAAYLSVINQHFSKRIDAVNAGKRARKDIDEVISELQS